MRDSLPIDMLLSTVYVLAIAQSSSEVPEGLMNNPVCYTNTTLYHVIYSVWYYPRFHITAAVLGTYYPRIRGSACIYIYRVFQEERAKLRESVPYVKKL